MLSLLMRASMQIVLRRMSGQPLGLENHARDLARLTNAAKEGIF
jgi:hypothetical protein